MCTKNHNHMTYSSWGVYIERWTSFFVIFGHFWPFIPLTIQKIKILKKWKKKSGDVIILHMCTKNHNRVMRASWDMQCERHHFLILGHFLHFNPTNLLSIFCLFNPPPPPLPPLTAWKIKILKPGDIIILHIMCTKNYDHMMYCFWDLVCDRRTKRQTDKRMKKWHTEVGAPPKNLNLKDCIRSMLD